MMPVQLKFLNLTKQTSFSDIRKGSKNTCSLFADIAHNASLIATIIAASGYDMELYSHAVAVSCIKYYHNVINS